MEKFIKFRDDITLSELSSNLKSDKIIILRYSQMTRTFQIQTIGDLSNRQIQEAFRPLVIEKIYDEYPYPLKHRRSLLLYIGHFLNKLQRFLVFAK